MCYAASAIPTDLAPSLAEHGLILRGGFHPDPEEAELAGVGTVVLVGNAGPAMWQAFAPHIDGAANPLDRWTRRVIEPIARKFGARAVFPFGEPHWPFQRWARRAESLHPSPLGILIHPEFGLWHAWRAALLFDKRLELPALADAPSPCASCADKPCLTACPVGAFSQAGYDVDRCAQHLRGPAADCLSIGCRARNACPVGEAWRYPEAQIRFHMTAFVRASVPGC
jgi:ferredoxin-like protein FixX